MGAESSAPVFKLACDEAQKALGKRCEYANSGFVDRGDVYDPPQLWVTADDYACPKDAPRCPTPPSFGWLKPLYHEFERNYDPEPVLNMMKENNYVLPVTAVVLYCLFLYFGTKHMKSRTKPYPLKTAFAYWNLFLSLFSFYGVTRTVPHLLYRIYTEDFEDTVCKSAHVGYGGGTAGLAVQIFILSKIPELLDTVFLILLKKEVIFLHWDHHITVLLYCWNSYVTESGAGLWFVAMNYSVHSIMYMYFYLQTTFASPKVAVDKDKIVPKPTGMQAFVKAISKHAYLITVFQILQMFMGTSLVLASFYYSYYGLSAGKKFSYRYALPGVNDGTKCANTGTNLFAGGIMYASYFYLFVHFAFRRFVLGKDDFAKKGGPLVAQKSESDLTGAASSGKAGSKKAGK